MTYPGDSSLSPEIQQRILTTYRQTLQLASQGDNREALLGCDFVVRLDSQFSPARTLQQMIQSGSPQEVFGELLEALDAIAPPAATAAGFDDVPELRLEFGAGAETQGGTADLAARLGELLAERRFRELIALAESERRSVASDPALRQVVETARARQEAEPYVMTFLDPARQALQAGETDEFDRLMRKARALDESHPALAELDQAKIYYSDPGRLLGGRRRGLATEEGASAPAAGDSEAGGFDSSLELPELDFSAPISDGDGFDLGGDESSERTGGGEGAGRIAELMSDGDGAFERGEYQAAIDAWSRIFLIDIDHQEAAQRIEQARQLKAEREREVEEHFHDAVERFDNGDYAAAQEGFERVLGLQSGYVLAQEYLEKIEERRQGGPVGAPPLEPVSTSPLAAGTSTPRTAARDELSEEILVPPEPGQERPVRRSAALSGTAVAAKRRAGLSLRFLVIGGAVLALLGVAGWFVLNRWDSLFPNAKAVATPAPAVADPIVKARRLHDEGKTALAIAQLRRIPPEDPRYGEAQSLVSQWEAIEEEAEQPTISAAQALRRRELIDAARVALANGRNALARSQLQRAGAIAPLAGEEGQLVASAEEGLASFALELELYRDGEYEYLLNQLWRRREAEKGNLDLDQLLVDSYYNLGVIDLQRGDPAAALDKFREARKLDADDSSLERLERFAAAYERKGEDLLYRIFIKYIQSR